MKPVFLYAPLDSGSGDAMEQQLWEYIDGVSDEPAKKHIEQLIASQAEWKQKYQELLELNTLLLSDELEQPSLRFTKNVMEQIGVHHVAPATRNYINQKLIWGIGAFFGLSLIAFLVYGFRQVNWSSGEKSRFPDLSKVEIGNFFNNTWINGFMMLNIIMGLFILDSYLRRQRKQWKKG